MFKIDKTFEAILLYFNVHLNTLIMFKKHNILYCNLNNYY